MKQSRIEFLPELWVVTVRTVKRPTEILAGTWIFDENNNSNLGFAFSFLPIYDRSRTKQKKGSQWALMEYKLEL
jgi:hypothetical protein